MIHIGVDPGVGGAIARIHHGRVKVYKVPTIIRKITGRKKKTVKDYDIKACVELLKKLKHYHRHDKGITRVKVWIEGVHPFLGSKVSNFNLGRGKGIWEGIVIALGLHYELVGMLRWKNEFLGSERNKKGKRKKESVQIALELYPKLKKYLKTKKDHDMAEAVLIAEHGRRQTR
jgi:hypothetical protein